MAAHSMVECGARIPLRLLMIALAPLLLALVEAQVYSSDRSEYPEAPPPQPPSSASVYASLNLPSAPGAPVAVAGSVTGTSMTVEWQQGAFSESLPVTGYELQSKELERILGLLSAIEKFVKRDQQDELLLGH